MKPEQKFQHAVLKTLKEVYNCAAYPMSTTIPGFPDALVTKNNKTILLEFKYVEFSKETKSLKNVFQETQPPFYYDYISKSGSGNIFVVFKCVNKNNATRFHIMRMNLQIAKAIRSETMDFVDTISSRNYTLTELVADINSIIEAQ